MGNLIGRVMKKQFLLIPVAALTLATFYFVRSERVDVEHLLYGTPSVKLIGFEEVTPGPMPVPHLWHGIGMDHNGKIYAGIGNGEEKRGKPGDVFIFEYDPVTESKRFLKSVRQILADERNLGPNEYWPKEESVAKIHSEFLEYNGRMYFSTHDWHSRDFKDKDIHRGGHFLSFDPRDGTFTDLSKTDPLGVSVVNDGIIGMNILRKGGKLVGWTSPNGQLLVHDLNTHKTKNFGRGLPEGVWTNVSRVIITSESGGIYASYSKDEDVPGNDRLYKLNWETEKLEPTDQLIPSRGRFEGIAETSDEKTIFLADTDGTLYSFDVEAEELRDLGSVLTDERVTRGDGVELLYNMALSPDERKLFTIPHKVLDGDGSYHLYEYDIVSGKKTDLGALSKELRKCMPTGNGVFDHKRRYYISFFCDEKNRAGILRIDVSGRVQETAAVPVISPQGGPIVNKTQVSISSRTPGAGIRYTTDGTEPTLSSTKYTGPIIVEKSSAIKARAFKEGLEKSRVARAYFFEEAN
ncbi:MAG: chitobiase/beta-hexosaminidase C-terminal domain-containing protein [Thermodesulfobacteriota bacterium]